MLEENNDYVNAKNDDGQTGWMLAARQGRQHTVKLLDAKADLSHADNNGQTALMLAEYERRSKAAKISKVELAKQVAALQSVIDERLAPKSSRLAVKSFEHCGPSCIASGAGVAQNSTPCTNHIVCCLSSIFILQLLLLLLILLLLI